MPSYLPLSSKTQSAPESLYQYCHMIVGWVTPRVLSRYSLSAPIVWVTADTSGSPAALRSMPYPPRPIGLSYDCTQFSQFVHFAPVEFPVPPFSAGRLLPSAVVS